MLQSAYVPEEPAVSTPTSPDALPAENAALRARVAELEARLRDAENQQSEAQRMYESLFEQAPIGIQVFNRDGLLLHINEVSRQLLGLLDTSHAVGKFNVLTDTFMLATGYAEPFARAYAGETVHIPEVSLNFDDPSNRWPTNHHATIVERTLLPFRDADGIVAKVFSFMLDISARKLAEQERQLLSQRLEQQVAKLDHEIGQRRRLEIALSEYETRFQIIWEGSADAMALSDSEGVVLLANPAYCQLYGYAAEHILGKPFTIIFPEEKRAWAMNAYRRVFNGPEPTIRTTTTIQRADGALRHVESHARFLIRDDRRVAMLAVIHDTTERQRASEAKKLESIGVLAGGVAHDFNNLLTSMLGNVELALLDLPPDSAAAAGLAQVIVAAQRAAGLTRQLLAYAGKGQFMLVPLQINGVIRELEALLHHSHSIHCDIVYDLAEPLPDILADDAQIRQAMLNLLLNAAEATNMGTIPITIATTVEFLDEGAVEQLMFGAELSPGPYVRLTIADRGRGMDQATLDRAFEPFFSTKFTGRGLGLAAVQGIVRSHGGAVQLTSTPGIGTTVRLWFPASTPAASLAPETPLAAPTAGGIVLLIDDEDTVREVAQRQLERGGYRVYAAPNGPAGLDMLREGIPDLAGVLLDLTMPHMMGDEVAHAIHELRPGTPIILMSGYSAEALAEQHANIGVVGFIQKPFSRATLLAAVERLLGGDTPAAG
jgi:PAS domain S-box-containing protein